MTTEYSKQRKADYIDNYGINNNTRKTIRQDVEATFLFLNQAYNYRYVMENMKK
jgi:hypothetical protein